MIDIPYSGPVAAVFPAKVSGSIQDVSQRAGPKKVKAVLVDRLTMPENTMPPDPAPRVANELFDPER